MTKFEDFMFKIFWKTKEEVVTDENGKFQLKGFLSPRFGKIGTIIWFVLTTDMKFEKEESEDNNA